MNRIVIKFGGSVLRSAEDIERLIAGIGDWMKHGNLTKLRKLGTTYGISTNESRIRANLLDFLAISIAIGTPKNTLTTVAVLATITVMKIL